MEPERCVYKEGYHLGLTRRIIVGSCGVKLCLDGDS